MEQYIDQSKNCDCSVTNLKNCSLARRTLPRACVFKIFMSKSMFSYQLGPLYVKSTLPVGGNDIWETSVMKWNVIEAGRR